MEKKANLIIISGRLCTGKSTLSEELRQHNGYKIIKSREILKRLVSIEFLSGYRTEREGLINYAVELDKQTNGSWIADNLPYEIIKTNDTVFDSIRLISQLNALRVKFMQSNRIFHIHLSCSDDILAQRFSFRNENKRNNIESSINDFIEAKGHPVELLSEELEAHADLVISTDILQIKDLYLRVVNYVDIN